MDKAKYRLKKAHFDFEGAEVSYTTQEVGGAASLKNEAYLFKSMADDSKESVEEVSDTTSEAGITGETADEDVSKTNENNEDDMSQELMDKVEQLQKQLAERDHEVAVEKASTAFGKFDLEAELVKELAEAFQGESAELVVKALEVIVAAKDEAMTKALEDKQGEENPLAKSLEEEAGHDEAAETPVAKSLQERLDAYEASKTK